MNLKILISKEYIEKVFCETKKKKFRKNFEKKKKKF